MPTSMTIQGEPILLDELLAKLFGAALARDLLTVALDLNPGLAEAGPVLPIGRTVILPDRPATVVSTKPVVSIFGN
ncbi:tail protein X [Aureimonas phyllosphaerae]|uniref:Phage tail protein X n=1 Tax=Aureimonas phyllosphaerae TaxID=1166078 RepID=A0A7W6FWI2_9HYPH|nr:tail protein X [Aureimonas phyllosphaerae]MBB3937950.1 phage tail protein X [Aureimonas phyllosphaerae]MBB3961876.1 phage tail protein X [Aureimonas phyllosphaerae]SFF54396.1 P2-like prophage tail protein X [Aureimonas phyllosphaerae]